MPNDSFYVNDEDYTLDELKDFVRNEEDAVPELQDVKLSQTKKELIEDINAALDAHLTAEADGTEVEDFAEEDSVDEDDDDTPPRGQASGDPYLGDAGPTPQDLLG